MRESINPGCREQQAFLIISMRKESREQTRILMVAEQTPRDDH